MPRPATDDHDRGARVGRIRPESVTGDSVGECDAPVSVPQGRDCVRLSFAASYRRVALHPHQGRFGNFTSQIHKLRDAIQTYRSQKLQMFFSYELRFSTRLVCNSANFTIVTHFRTLRQDRFGGLPQLARRFHCCDRQQLPCTSRVECRRK